MTRTLLGICVAATLAVSACGSSTTSASVKPSPSPHPSLTPTLEATLSVGGRDRTYLLFRPTTLQSGPLAPLVLALHGYTQSALELEYATQLDDEATKAGFVVVYPQGIQNSWNAGACCGSAQSQNLDDVAFIAQLIDKLVSDRQVDAKRVYVTGLSNGGFMAYRLACELSDRILAIASVSGAMVTSNCQPTRLVSVLEMHGTNDPVVPMEGNTVDGGIFPPTDSTLRRWASLDGCGTAPDVAQAGIAKISTWGRCREGTRVVLEAIQGGGHSWFAAVDRPTEPDATEVVWSFFSQTPLRP